MASWEDVRRIALDLPGVVEDGGGHATTGWRVGGKPFAWERVLRRGEREQLGDLAPPGPALGLRTAGVEVVDGLLAARPDLYFVVAGYGVHPMVLLRVEHASFEDLDEAITEAWLARASRRLAQAFLAAAAAGGPGPDRQKVLVEPSLKPSRASRTTRIAMPTAASAHRAMLIQAITLAAVTSPSPVSRPPEARMSRRAAEATNSAATAGTSGNATNDTMDSTSATTALLSVSVGPYPYGWTGAPGCGGGPYPGPQPCGGVPHAGC